MLEKCDQGLPSSRPPLPQEVIVTFLETQQIGAQKNWTQFFLIKRYESY